MRAWRVFLCILAALIMLAPLQAALAQGSGGETLRAFAVERPPFVMKDNNGQLTGFSVDLWTAISDRLGAEGRVVEKATFADMLGDLEKGQADLAIGNISITAQREAVLDFSQPFLDSGLQILVRHDSSKSQDIGDAIWNSPAPLVAAVGVLALLVVSVLMWALERGRDSSIRNDFLGGVWDSFWWAFITLTTGGGDRPASALSRVFAMVWVLVGLLFVSSLTASITTFLTVQQLSTGVQSYKDLKGMKVGLAEGTTMARFAEARQVAYQSYPDSQDVLRALESGEIQATFLDAPVAQYYALNDGASVAALAGPVFAPDKLGIAFPNGSALRERVNRALLTLIEDGSYDKLHRKYFGE